MSSDKTLQKPYYHAGAVNGPVGDSAAQVSEALAGAGFEVLGEHSPGEVDKRRVICFTSAELTEAAAKSGDRHGLASVLRVGLDENDDGSSCVMSVTSPMYWGPAMHHDKWDDALAEVYRGVDEKLVAALKAVGGDAEFEAFGEPKGFTAYTLMWYRYAFGMERFSHPVDAGTFESHQEGVEHITAKLRESGQFVYAHKVSENVHVFGVGLNGPTGEAHFLPTIDVGPEMHTPAFPYELVLVDGKATTLHGRFRIALAFPGTTLAQFMKIVTTPGNIEAAMKALCE